MDAAKKPLYITENHADLYADTTEKEQPYTRYRFVEYVINHLTIPIGHQLTKKDVPIFANRVATNNPDKIISHTTKYA